MIITHVHITNYKQFGGSHDIDFPQMATIGVIGANGVGKTTLFEAIEWALYSPSSIRSQEVRPRTYSGKTQVNVTLEDEASGVQYVVERELPKGSAKARIYRTDSTGAEEKIVDGAAEVTAYVTNHLIGLDHAAFVATFFTRQKELGFFGGSPTARRRDVGKLLGLETIRTAQQIIAEDRKKSQSDARSYRAMHEAELRDRDFAAEIEAAEKQITASRDAVGAAATQVEQARAAVQAAERELAGIEKVREQDSQLNQKLMQKQREHDLAQQQLATATRDLERLTEAARERDTLAPIAATAEELREEEAGHSQTRQKALRKRELEQALAALERRARDSQEAAVAAVNSAPAPDKAAAWQSNDLAAAIQWAGEIDIATLEARTAAANGAVEQARMQSQESQTLEKYHARIAQLQADLDKLKADGDPAAQLEAIDARVQQLQASTSAADTTRKRTLNDLQKAEHILKNLRAQKEGETCPTCQRPFTADDSATMIAVFEREAAGYLQQLEQIRQQMSANTGQIEEEQRKRASLIAAITKITETQASIQSGNAHIQEQQAKVDAIADRVRSALAALGRTEPPTAEEATSLATELTAWRRVVDAAQAVQRQLSGLKIITQEREPIQQELGTLADVAYDEAAHRAVTARLQEAMQAQNSVTRIDADLARKPEIETSQSASREIMASAATELESLQAERSQLGFDANALLGAQNTLRTARENERGVVEQSHRSQTNLREAEHALTRIEGEQERISKLAVKAEARQRDADDLDQMYKEFTEFERFAAAWYAPRLSEITSEMVDQVTDGKYNRVEFDTDFSIRVYDGDDESYPYEQFSGGERDAIALCARIALSRLIGGASATPPGFLVLDEVFGSLDMERRQRLLEMLGAITGAGDHFRQVFLISHVDDVRTSPILDEIWRVAEEESGRSTVESLGVGADIGEL